MIASCHSELSATFGGKRDNNGRASTFRLVEQKITTNRAPRF